MNFEGSLISNYTWEFPKIRGSAYNQDPTIQGTILGSPIFGNSHIEYQQRLKPYPKYLEPYM